MSKNIHITLLITLIAFPYLSRASNDSLKLQALVAYGKAYGIVRFFYPNKYNQAFDWENFCEYSVDKILNNDETEDGKFIQTLLSPVAPLLVINDSRSNLPDQSYPLSSKVVYYKHTGVKLNNDRNNENYTSEVIDGNLTETQIDEEARIYKKQLNNKYFLSMPIGLNFDTYGKNTSLIDTLIGDINSHKKSENISVSELWITKTIIIYNIIQHFYPYRQLLNNWDKSFETTISKLINTTTDSAARNITIGFLSTIDDAHIFLQPNKTVFDVGKAAYLPIITSFINDSLVVVQNLNDKNQQLQSGDIIVSVNDHKVDYLFNELAKLSSGSIGVKQIGFADYICMGKINSDAKLEVVKKNREMITCNLVYDMPISKHYNAILKNDGAQKMENDIAYVDLSTTSFKQVQKMVTDINKKKGVIFDLRNYPYPMSDEVIANLIQQTDTSKYFMVPEVTYPDFQNVHFQKVSLDYKPNKKRIVCKVVFLTNHNTISYGETILSVVKSHHLGTVIGESSAGANGDINYIEFSDGDRFRFSGIYTTMANGESYQGLGIEPDIKVFPTINGVRSGKDEILEAGINYIKANQ